MFEIVQCVQMYNKTTWNFQKDLCELACVHGGGSEGAWSVEGVAVNQLDGIVTREIFQFNRLFKKVMRVVRNSDFGFKNKISFVVNTRGKGGKGSGVWPSMVTHTRNLSSAFNPSKCTLTAVNTHLEQWAAILRRPGSSWGIGALLKGLTSVVVLKVERALVIHSPHRQSLPDLGIEPATFGLQVQLSNH